MGPTTDTNSQATTIWKKTEEEAVIQFEAQRTVMRGKRNATLSAMHAFRHITFMFKPNQINGLHYDSDNGLFV